MKRGHRYTWLHNERLGGNEYWGTIHIMAWKASSRVRQCLKEDDCIVCIYFGDSDLDQDYTYIFWRSVCVCFFVFNEKWPWKIQKTAKFYLSKNKQSKLSAKRDFEKSKKCTRSNCFLGAWSLPRLCRHRDYDDVNDDDDGDDDDVHGGGGKLLLRGTQSQASLDCRNNKFWSQSITIK